MIFGVIRIVFKGILFVTLSASVLATGTINIDKLVVPEVVQSGNSSSAVLNCLFTVADDRFSVQWLFNGRDVVYQWSPYTQPKVGGRLDGRIDLTYDSTMLVNNRVALRIVHLAPELSGEYTCRIVADDGTEVRQTRTMLVFSPEQDFELVFQRQQNDELQVKCYARGLYPQPEIAIEYNGEVIPKQQQRVWRSEGRLFDTECTAQLSPAEDNSGAVQLTCRLQVPQAGYTALKKEFLHIAQNNCSNNSVNLIVTKLYQLLVFGILRIFK